MVQKLLTERNVSQYFKSVETGVIPTDPDAAVFWDCMQTAEIHVLNDRLHVLVTPMDTACPTKEEIRPVAYQMGEHELVQVFRGEGYNTQIGFQRAPRDPAVFVVMSFSYLRESDEKLITGDQTYKFLPTQHGFQNTSWPTPPKRTGIPDIPKPNQR